MATVKESIAAAAAITLSGAIASSGTAGRQSTVVDNSTNLYDEVLIEATVQYPNSAPANDKCMYLYGFGSTDGTNYPEGLGATDAAYTMLGSAGALTTALRLCGIIPANQNTNVKYGPFNLSHAFGGIIPVKWGLVLLNYSGQTITAFSSQYSGIYYTVT